MLVRFVVACDASLLDSRSNNASLIGIIEELRTAEFPAYVGFDVVCLLEKETGDPEVSDTVGLSIALNGVELRNIAVVVNFAGETRSRIFAEVRLLKLAAAGRLDVNVVSNGNQIGGWWMNVLESRRGTDRRFH